MAEKYSFFPDVEYTTFDWAKYFGSFIGNGVFPNPSTGLQVIANNDMTVTVKVGKAWIDGYFYRNESDLIIPIENADGVLKRIDNIVIQLDRPKNKITAKVIKGTFSSSPIAPNVLRTADYYDLKIAQISLNAGAISIVQSNITDTRLDSAVCGIVTQIVTTIDTATLYAQIQADLAGFKTNEQANFMIWFDTIKNVLDANTAGNLLNLINAHTSDLSLHAVTLTHTKTATAHNLVGTLPTSGIISANFVATADFLANETFSVNSVSYSAKPNGEEQALPDKAFIVGDLVNVTIDIGGKKLGFKLGGSVNDTLPSQITRLAGEAQNGAVKLTWINPTTDFTGLYITRKAGSMPTKLSDGTKLDCGSATSYLDSGLINGTIYYYRSFPYNSKKQIQTEIADSVINVTPSSNISISELPVGTLIVDANTKYYNVPIIWKIADKNHSGYPANSVTLIAEQILTLKCFDAKEPNGSNVNHRAYGNNRYIHANIRSWLNSSASAGAWYTAQHSVDEPPNSIYTNVNPYDTQAGFLNTFSNSFRNALLTATLTVAENTVTGYGSYETFSDKLFLASNTEVGLVNENNIVEGAKLALFSNDTSRIATLTAEAASNGGNGSAGGAWYWWLRTPDTSVSYIPRIVGVGGASDISHAFGGKNGVRPLCNLSSSIRVKPQPNAQGQYEIAF